MGRKVMRVPIDFISSTGQHMDGVTAMAQVEVTGPMSDTADQRQASTYAARPIRPDLPEVVSAVEVPPKERQ